MFHRNAILMNFAPLFLIGAMLFVVAPACTMPGCGAFNGLVTMAEHGCQGCAADHGCEDFMMVNDRPDGVPAPTAPVIATISLSETPVPHDTCVSVPVLVESPVTPEYDPLGVRIRI